jgi:hypothetical protein
LLGHILFDEGIGDKRIGLQIQLVDKYNKNTNTEIPEGKTNFRKRGKGKSVLRHSPSMPENPLTRSWGEL